MKEYTNRLGKVTDITADAIFIDGDMFLTDTEGSRYRMACANPSIGDKVEFNFHDKTGELIYLKVLNPPYRGKESTSKDSSHGRYIEHQPGESVWSILDSLGGGGEMANLTLMSHDSYDEWADGDTM